MNNERLHNKLKETYGFNDEELAAVMRIAAYEDISFARAVGGLALQTLYNPPAEDSADIITLTLH